MKILIRAPLNNSGFGIIFRALIHSLGENGQIEEVIVCPQGTNLPQKFPHKDYVLLDCRLASMWGDDIEKPWKKKVGYSMLETDRINLDWMVNCNKMDLVIVPTPFNLETYTNSGVITKMVAIFPGNIGAGQTKKVEDLKQNNPNNQNRPYRFFSCGQWVPFSESRKGWEELIKTYCHSFTSQDNVELIIKPNLNFARGEGFEKIIAKIIKETGVMDIPRITLIDNQKLSAGQMRDLFSAADCFVQASHGEGLGLDYITAMSCGMDIIATQWSSLEYVLAGYPRVHFIPVGKLIHCPPGIDFWSAGGLNQKHKWAEIDTKRLGELMVSMFFRNNRDKISFILPSVKNQTDLILQEIENLNLSSEAGGTLFIMPEAGGDLLEVSATIRKYHLQHPDEKLYLMAKRRYWWILEGWKDCELIEYPDNWQDYHFLIRDFDCYPFKNLFQKVIEMNRYTQIQPDWIRNNIFPSGKSRREHYCDLARVEFAEKDMPYLPDFVSTTTHGDYIIIHPCACDDEGRKWNGWDELVVALNNRGWKQIIQVGGEKDELVQGVIDLRGIGYVDLLRLISGADYFIGIDSFISHLAGGLDKKGVALYGNTSAKYALSWRGQLHTLQARRNCSKTHPCHIGVCDRRKRCINNIDVGEVVSHIGA